MRTVRWKTSISAAGPHPHGFSLRDSPAARAALGLMTLVLALALSSTCAGPESTAVGTPAASGPGQGAARARGASAPDAAAIDLEAMLAPVPEYEGMGRNLFAYGPVRVTAVDPPPPEPVFEPPPVQPPPRPPTPPMARLNMKYAGFLEKTRSDGEKAKYAIFLDGNEILAGAEGETVANRFTVVEIGLESVTVSASGSKATQRIPLQSN